MTEAHPFILKCLKDHYGLDIATLQLLPIGADLKASLYRAVGHDQIAYFVKIKKGGFQEVSLEIKELLWQAGVREIILPIATLEGKKAELASDFTMIVYPFIPGQNGFSKPLSSEQWEQLGKTLRCVHDLAVPDALQKRIRQENFSSKWRDAVRFFLIHLVVEKETDVIGLMLMEVLKQQQTVIRQLVQRAEKLSQKLRSQSPKFVLCHSDIHAGNILLGDNGAFYIVDWDDPVLAPKERDLMFIGGGVGNVWNKPLEEELFYRGYGVTEVNKELLAYYRCERIVEDIAEYCEELLMGTQGDNRIQSYQQFVDMFEPNGVIDIAFKT